VAAHRPEGVLITGVYGAGKSSVAAEVASVLETRGDRYALLDLDYLSWATPGDRSRSGEVQLMVLNLAAVSCNYLQAGIERFILAYFVRERGELQAVRTAVPFPLRIVRLDVPLAEISRRLAGDVTSGRKDDLREAGASMAGGAGVGLEDITLSNDRPLQIVVHDLMSFVGWL
jgi:hypothetical protein